MKFIGNKIVLLVVVAVTLLMMIISELPVCFCGDDINADMSMYKDSAGKTNDLNNKVSIGFSIGREITKSL